MNQTAKGQRVDPIIRALDLHRQRGRIHDWRWTGEKRPWQVNGKTYSAAQVTELCDVLAAMDNPRHPAPAVVDHDADTVTFAVTINWRRPWALDHCETAVVAGDLYRLLIEHYGDPEWDQLAGLAAVSTWEPNEERHVGHNLPPVQFERAKR